MRFRKADPSSPNYLIPEAWFNNIKLIEINGGTELVMGVAMVDSNGNFIGASQWKANENHSSAQTNNALQSAPGSGLSLYITDMTISNGATEGTVKIVEDTGGSPATILGPYYFAANGGMSKKFATPVKVTSNKDVGFTSTSVTTHTITLLGYIAP